MPPPGLTMETLDLRLSYLEADRRLIAEALTRFAVIGETLQAIKRDLDEGRERMKGTEGDMDAVSDRVFVLEAALPLLREYGDWVKRAAIGIYGILAAIIVGVVIAALAKAF